MNRRALAAGALALLGCAAVLVGVRQELLHFRPTYDATIHTGWGGEMNHEERLLVQLGALGLLGAIGASRWRPLAVVPAVTGGVVLFYPLRAMARLASDPGIYTGVPMLGDPAGRFVLGAEPFLLVAAGCLFVVSGGLAHLAHATQFDPAEGSDDAAPTA